MQKDVTEDVNEDEIVSDVAEAYGVDENDVTVDTSYDVTGTMTLEVPDSWDDTAVLEAFLEENLADILGVDPSRVLVSIFHGAVTFLRSQWILLLALLHTQSAQTLLEMQQMCKPMLATLLLWRN